MADGRDLFPAHEARGAARPDAPAPIVAADLGLNLKGLRWIVIHLTPFAPGLEGADLSDASRWLRRANTTPRAACNALLTRLGRRGDQLRLATLPLGEIAVLTRDDSARSLLAIVTEGMTEAEMREALDSLDRRGPTRERTRW
jgi:hypothetical protein